MSVFCASCVLRLRMRVNLRSARARSQAELGNAIIHEVALRLTSGRVTARAGGGPTRSHRNMDEVQLREQVRSHVKRGNEGTSARRP
jgi:hypothetical protein